MHGQHRMATHHPKRMPRPNPTTPTFPPDHYIQHTPKFPLHNPYHEQPHILLLRLPQPPATPGHRHDTQHPPSMVLWTRNITPTPTTRNTRHSYPKHSPANGRMDVWHTHTPHQPRHHITRAHPHTRTHPTTRRRTLPIPPQIHNHGGTRHIRN